MADREDLLASQAVHAIFAALGGLQIMGDSDYLIPNSFRGVYVPEDNARVVYSDTYWTETSALGEKVKVRYRVRAAVDIERLYY